MVEFQPICWWEVPVRKVGRIGVEIGGWVPRDIWGFSGSGLWGFKVNGQLAVMLFDCV